MWLFATLKDRERIPYKVEIPGKHSLNIVVGRRKPNCYLCGIRGPLVTQCLPYRPLQMVEDKEIIFENNKGVVECSKGVEMEMKRASEEQGDINSPAKKKKKKSRNIQ